MCKTEAPFRIQSSRLVVLVVVASSPEGMTKYAQFENIIIFPTIFEIYRKKNNPQKFASIQKPPPPSPIFQEPVELTPSKLPWSASILGHLHMEQIGKSKDPWGRRSCIILKGDFLTWVFLRLVWKFKNKDVHVYSVNIIWIPGITLSWPFFLVGRNLGLVFFLGGGGWPSKIEVTKGL